MKKLLLLVGVPVVMILLAPLAVAIVVASILTPAAVKAIDCGAGVPATAAGDWRPPFQQRYALTSRYGRRFHPVYRQWRLHPGLDLSSLPGAGPVVAAASGTVVSANTEPVYGKIVSIRHGNGVVTRYGHLSKINSKIIPGSTVAIGQQLGVEGSTGTSTGLHLHFQVEINGTPVDPVPFMADRGAPLDGEAVAPSKDGTSPTSLRIRGDVLEGGIGFPLPQPRTPRRDSRNNPPLTIPPKIKKLYIAAADKYKIPWALLAGIGMAKQPTAATTAPAPPEPRG